MTYCKANSCYNSINYSWEDYCSYHKRCLEKVQSKIGFFYPILEMETFETWFNKNCGWVIIKTNSESSNYPYHIYVIIYEPALRDMSENMGNFEYKRGYESLSGARSKAMRIKNKLQNNGFDDTPMLKIHPKAKNWENFGNLITSPYIAREWLSYKISEPDLHFKPLDLVKVDEGNYKHVGVYIGNNLVCHFSKRYNGVRIHSWDIFVEDYHKGNGEITGYHPIIPFKNYRKIAKQIAWARDANFRENKYELANRSCEHFANMITYGINYSEQIEDKKNVIVTKNVGVASLFPLHSFIFNYNYDINNDKDSTIKLTNEMSETNDKLEWKTNELSNDIERWYLQEVPPKENCRIM